MDSLINAAARALATGDALGALNRVALRDDAPALALRGIAMAQLGDLPRARTLLKRAMRGFGRHEPLARARCVVADTEIALVSRDLGWPEAALDAARDTLAAHGDALNAAHAGHLAIRRLLLLGRLDAAERRLAGLDASRLPPALRTIHELTVAGIASRRLHTTPAREALLRAAAACRLAGIASLQAEVEAAAAALDAPAARLVRGGEARLLRLDEVEALQGSPALIVDACRNAVRCGRATVPLASRPVLFGIVRLLAEAWPKDASRDLLLRRVFRARDVDESHRARLRVEIGRLRALLRGLADIEASKTGFRLRPHRHREVAILAWPVEDKHASLLALLADGEAWSSSGLAMALAASQRNVQRGLDALAAAGKVQHFGHGRARRWTTPPVSGFTTTLLLPGSLPAG